ncbi:MAG: DUF58 domain-containing protein [Polyangiaceae bacterium]|nr:DUF58 domain-containing protein [Polyangiaceae bacterium]
MQLHPTRPAVDVAIAGIVTMAVGLLSQTAAVLGFGAAMLVGLAIARAVTQVGVARIRSAGFEMLWRSEPRVRRIGRRESVTLEAEVRNRDTRAARYVELRAVCSPNLVVKLEPTAGEVPASGRLSVQVTVTGARVGRHGIHGLSLEVRGAPGLFEVPLTFANPFGIEVLPRAFSSQLSPPRGGRSRQVADDGRPGPLSGDGLELRELREHQPGDPFKRIAWKASARRGRLMVRDYEREERDVVWLLLDASVELWSGEVGAAPLDLAIDEVAAAAARHLSRGDRVGLGIVAGRTLGWLRPDRGPAHAMELMSALSHRAHAHDGDRSDLDEADVAYRVLEHARPLDPAAVAGVRPGELDRVARRAERLRSRAPFPDAEVHAPSARERTLRRYLAAFGAHCPPRLEPERTRTDLQLATALERAVREKPRPSVMYLWSPTPDLGARPEIERALARFPRRRVELRWVGMRLGQSIPTDGSVTPAVADALRIRARVAEERGARSLGRLGIRVEHLRSRVGPPPAG